MPRDEVKRDERHPPSQFNLFPFAGETRHVAPIPSRAAYPQGPVRHAAPVQPGLSTRQAAHDFPPPLARHGSGATRADHQKIRTREAIKSARGQLAEDHEKIRTREAIKSARGQLAEPLPHLPRCVRMR